MEQNKNFTGLPSNDSFDFGEQEAFEQREQKKFRFGLDFDVKVDEILAKPTEVKREEKSNYYWLNKEKEAKLQPDRQSEKLIIYDHDHNLDLEKEGADEDAVFAGNWQKPEVLNPQTMQQLLDLMQITNANFPIGSFSHSFGIETYIRKELVHNAKTLKKVIKAYVFGQFLYVDLLGIIATYQAINKQNIDRLWELDQITHASGMSRETVDGARRIGSQMVKIYRELFPDNKNLQLYQERIQTGECSGVPGVAFGIMAKYLEVDLRTALYVHLYSSISAQIQNAVRAIPLGQIQGQKLMLEVKQDYFQAVIERAMQADLSTEFCKNAPAFEIAQMEHEDTNVRLFMS